MEWLAVFDMVVALWLPLVTTCLVIPAAMAAIGATALRISRRMR